MPGGQVPRPRNSLAQEQDVDVNREFRKGGLVQGGLATNNCPLCNCDTLGSVCYVQIEKCLIAKPPFTKPPFVNSRVKPRN